MRGNWPIRIKSAAALLVALVLTPGISRNEGGIPPWDKEPSLFFQNIRVFDGEKLLHRTNVLIREGRIAALGPDITCPQGANLIRGDGSTLMPGLIDSHVHIRSEADLHQCLVFGVTSVVDMFMDIDVYRRIAHNQAAGEAQGQAFLVSSGILATAPGGHGTQYGISIPTLSGPDEAEAFVEARIAEGSSFIKVICDDGTAYGNKIPALKPVVVRAIVEAAHVRGKKVVVHAATLQNCLEVMEAGADGLAHLFFDNTSFPGFGKKAARSGIFVIPTLSILQSMAGLERGKTLAKDSSLAPFIKPPVRVALNSTFPFISNETNFRAAEAGLRQLLEESVPVLAGTDAPNPGTAYGVSLHDELSLLAGAGMSPIEVLQAATSRPADFFSINERGRIRIGYRADLVMVDGDPTLNPSDTRKIISVWKAGRKVDREAFREEVLREKSREAELRSMPPPKGSESGWISDFDGEKVGSRFGAGWTVSTDTFMGGKSQAAFSLISGGADASPGALRITGQVSAKGAIHWAGMLFSPGPGLMAPVNLSGKQEIEFWARGEPGQRTVMVFARCLGYIPAMRSFTVGPEWTRFRMTIESFGIEGYDIMGLFFGASQEPGSFSLDIDQVRLK